LIASKNALADTERGNTMKVLLSAVLLILLTPAGACPQSQKPNSSDNKTEILWDTWGVPHIFAKDTESAARAFGWAQMQSNGNRLLRSIAWARGRGAEYFGKDLLEADEVTRRMGLYAHAQKWRAQQSPEFGRYLEGFVAGINDYSRQHAETLAPSARSVLPVDSTDIIALVSHILFQFVATAGGCTGAFHGHSNGWAIGPSRSTNGHAMLLANPQVPWGDWLTSFEAHIVSPDYNFYGVTFVGLPVFLVGFNDSLGWTETVNTLDACDLYELVPDGDGYSFDGKKHEFSLEKQIIKVRNQDGTTTDVPFEVRRAVQGPVFRQGTKLLAVRLAGLEVSSMGGAMEEWWAMGKARKLAQFQAALERMQIPMFNVVYADHDGHILLVFNGQVPVRSKGHMDFWLNPVPGDDSSLVWNQIHPYRDLPKGLDPPSGWVQSSNGPPWFMTVPFRDPKDYTPYASPRLPGDILGTSLLGWLTPREQSGLGMLLKDGKISMEKLVEDKYSTRSQLADRVLDDLIDAAKRYGSSIAKQAAQILQTWNRNIDADSRGAAIFEFWAEEMSERDYPGFYAQPFDSQQPLKTPHGLKDPEIAAEALDLAANKLTKVAGRLDVAWGDLYRLRRGKIDLPGNGAGDLLGTFRVIDYSPASDGRFASEAGDNFIAAVEFGPTVQAKVLLTAGNSSDPNSPHFGDQLVLAARKQLRDAWLTRSEVEQHIEQRTLFNHDGKVISIPPLQ
jgi:acyl-homoserine-lactone acylase